MLAQGRFAARLANLPHEALLKLAAQGCSENEAVRRAADSTLALHDPTPAWAIERILTSPDLLLHIFAHVEMKDHAGARVCKAWKRGWDATDDQRRGLRPTELAEEDFKVPHGADRGAELTSLPGERLCLSYDDTMRIMDANMQTLHVHEPDFTVGNVAASEDGLLYVSDDDQPKLRRYRLEEDSSLTLTATYDDDTATYADDEERYAALYFPTPAPDGMLFAVGSMGIDGVSCNDEIVAFDATTLTVRNRFGLGEFGALGPQGMAVVGEELYVCDRFSIHVFSMSGEHLRVIKGDWRKPEKLLLVRDRLYMIEQDENLNNTSLTPEQTKERLEAGKRIFVLTPQGKTIQKYRFDKWVYSMAILGDKLVVRTGDNGKKTFRALKGL